MKKRVKFMAEMAVDYKPYIIKIGYFNRKKNILLLRKIIRRRSDLFIISHVSALEMNTAKNRHNYVDSLVISLVLDYTQANLEI